MTSAAFCCIPGTTLSKEEPQFGRSVTKLGGLMRAIFSVHTGEALKKTITNGYVSQAINQDARNLGNEFDTDPIKVARIYNWCDAWREKIAIYFQSDFVKQQRTDKASQRQVLLEIPHAPKNLDLEKNNNDLSQRIVDAAFKKWSASGRVTSDTLRRYLAK